MKTKLLKKIRKQYKIHEIKDVSDCAFYNAVLDKFGSYPIFDVIGYKCMIGNDFDHVFKTYNEAVDFIVKDVFKTYDIDRFRRKFTKQVVVEMKVF